MRNQFDEIDICQRSRARDVHDLSPQVRSPEREQNGAHDVRDVDRVHNDARQAVNPESFVADSFVEASGGQSSGSVRLRAAESAN